MKRHNLFWGSSYDRGLDVLLFLWPDIIEKHPNAQLHITYGWDLFDLATVNNPERKKWKQNVQTLMQLKGVKHYGRLNKKDLQEVRQKCGIWAYPTYFTEINCITALEAQNDGLVPVTMSLGALKETVGSGIKLDGSIYQKEIKDRYLASLLTMMDNRKLWREESKKAIKFAKHFSWSKIMRSWVGEFETPITKPLVSIITPTIRKGFWNIMAHNISQQTYKNLEWIVVDDYPEDRSEVMKKYCDKYKLKYQYLRGKPNNNRQYGLSSANNVGWKASKGSLCVWLQDFVLMGQHCIEDIVNLHRKFPNALIAPVDKYYKPKVKPNTDSEDWFSGELDVLGDLMRVNQRLLNNGMRLSENASEFEMNLGAIPKKVLKELNGFWEFFDEALGFDNTEIAYRALLLGSEILVDDKIVISCIDHWEPLKDKPDELGKDRIFNLNDPRFEWMISMMGKDKLPLKHNQVIDDKCILKYKIPKSVNQDGAVKWMRKNTQKIIKTWNNIL